MTPPQPASDVRTVAGRYRLLQVLGRGGMGTVWLAEDLLLRREVALKELLFPDTLLPDQQEELRRRSLREAQAAARISSPHAVKVYDVVTDGGRPWIVMERHHGRALSEIIRTDGPLSPAEAARIGIAILAALENAHGAGIVHRDVKPSNVLVRSDGHVTLTDFGIARGIEDTTITRTGMIVGSPAYVAPERATGAPALPPSDLWALGATLYTAVEGHPPYDRGDPMQTLAAVMYAEPEPCRAAGPLAPTIEALLARDPADRPSIPAARAALTAVAGATPAGTRTLPLPGPLHSGDRTVLLPAGPAPVSQPHVAAGGPPGPQPRRAARVAVVLAAALALLAGAVALVNALGNSPTDPGRRSAHTPTSVVTPRSAAARTEAATGTQPTGGTRSTTAAPSRSTGEPGSGPVAPLPAGLVAYTDPSVGWSIGRPAQWRVRQRGTLTDLVDPAGNRYLRIDTTDKPLPTAIGAWRDLERSFARRHGGYSRIRMETISWRGFDDVADWEYSYRQGKGRVHGINRGIVTGGRGYALNLQTSEDQWATSQPLMRQLFASFRPAG